MKPQLKHQEKGSVLVEIIAVVALLGVMGPLLFKQVADRNEEVENINIASEIRIMKEAFSSYIMSYHSEIAETCTNNVCSPTVNLIDAYLPAGYDGNTSNYHFIIINDTTGKGNNTLQGFVIPNLNSLGLEGLSLKRVARIATLIGADGGIYRKNSAEINGTGGAWALDTDYFDNTTFTFPEPGSATDHLFLATTGIDTFIPTVKFEDFDQSNILMPDEGYATKKLHAWNYFSVGQVDSTDASRCFELKHNTTKTDGDKFVSQSDTIYDAGENNCDPLFWVGASGGDGVAGNVFVKNQLHLRNSPSDKSSVSISSEPVGDDEKPTSVLIEGTSHVETSPSIDENKKRRIVVYTSNGKEAIVINGQGEIISTGSEDLASGESMNGTAEKETLTIKQGRIETNVKAINATAIAKSNQAYRVDPRYISIMGDIRLESRGGAKLSDILPTYQLKNIRTISSTEYNTTNNRNISMPTCPNKHLPAIVVTPVQWHQSTEQNIVDTISTHVKADTSGNLIAKGTTEINTNPILPKVKISSASTTAVSEYYRREDNTPTNELQWTVTLSYDQNGTEVTDIKTPIIATVHLYCVYNGDTTDIIEDRDNDASTAVGRE